MKFTYILLLILLIHDATTYAQTEKYYSFDWKECKPVDARYISTTTPTDSGWLRLDFYIRERKLQSQSLYADEAGKIKHGTFITLHANGRPESVGKYLNNQKEGVWLNYSYDGYLTDSVSFTADNRTGTSLGWFENGYLRDSSVFYVDGSGVAYSWFDNGNPSAAGKFAAGYLQNGIWNYYHKNGTLSAQIHYGKGTIREARYYNEAGEREPAATGEDQQAYFPGGLMAWQKYLKKKLSFPVQYRILGADHVTIVVDFIVNEDGSVTNVRVSAPFHPGYDDIAENIIKKSPKWIPAKEQNRNIKAYRHQPITFTQVEL